VSTHSSHVANEAAFEEVRYFLTSSKDSEGTIWRTRVKDLRSGLPEISNEDRKFLHQYLTLTRCDLFFADRAILIEGASERLLLPSMMEKLDKSAIAGPKLRSQYTTTIEVGGAYAHKFFKLLALLELKSLVITDLDPVEAPGGTKCFVHEAQATSNACIKAWFADPACKPGDLITQPEAALVRGQIRIAYQRPEVSGGPCGRTFEDAFMLANSTKFGVAGATREALERDAAAKADGKKKPEFALTYAIGDSEWQVPKYIEEGLKWLAVDNMPSAAAPGTPTGPQEGTTKKAPALTKAGTSHG
jgi:hypothetical protein